MTRGIIWKINMQDLWFLCMTQHLNVLKYKCMKFRWNTSNSYQVIEPAQWSKENNYNNIQSRAMVILYDTLSKCEKFQPNSFNSVQLTKRTKIAFSFVTRGIIWKINMQGSWFLCMTRRLNVLDKCMKFRWNTSKELSSYTADTDQRGITPKNIQSRVVVLVHDTLSHCAVAVYEVSTK